MCGPGPGAGSGGRLRAGSPLFLAAASASTTCLHGAPQCCGWSRWSPEALGEAAGFLAITSTDTKARIYSGAGFVHTGATRQPDPRSFETALSNLALELDSPATPLVNYQRRRHALQTWCIDEDAWDQLVGRLLPVPGPHQPELGDRKRQIASIYAWVQVTSGEHYFAPHPIEAAQPPEIQESWKERRNNILHLIRRDRPSPHYTNLRTELNTLATSLARNIDANRS